MTNKRVNEGLTKSNITYIHFLYHSRKLSIQTHLPIHECVGPYHETDIHMASSICDCGELSKSAPSAQEHYIFAHGCCSSCQPMIPPAWSVQTWPLQQQLSRKIQRTKNEICRQVSLLAISAHLVVAALAAAALAVVALAIYAHLPMNSVET